MNKNIQSYTSINDIRINLLKLIYFRIIFFKLYPNLYHTLIYTTKIDLLLQNNFFNSFANLLEPTQFAIY